MDVFQWGKYLETGHTAVDQQHRHLVEMTNAFGKHLSENGTSVLGTESLFHELISYTQYHFDEEEDLMLQMAVDERHLNSHRDEHRGFLHDVMRLHEEVDLANKATLIPLFEFLVNWLVYHILGSDMSMARQIEAIKKGITAAQAFSVDATLEGENAKELLLHSLKNLFHQVSERNKQLAELNANLEKKVLARTQDLEAANHRLEEIATTDALTGLPNRRFAMQLMNTLWLEALERQTPLGCMLVDADGFKEINDCFGHDAGDLVLSELAQHLKHAVRNDDHVCRLGGDEFLIICPKTDRDGSLHIANLVQAKIAQLRVPVNGGAWQGSVSVGVGFRTAAMKKPEDLIKAADEGVYLAKAAGKNCVRIRM